MLEYVKKRWRLSERRVTNLSLHHQCLPIFLWRLSLRIARIIRGIGCADYRSGPITVIRSRPELLCIDQFEVPKSLGMRCIRAAVKIIYDVGSSMSRSLYNEVRKSLDIYERRLSLRMIEIVLISSMKSRTIHRKDTGFSWMNMAQLLLHENDT